MSPPHTWIVVPEGYDGKTALPTVIWLHGWGQWSKSKALQPVFQQVANQYACAFVGINGPRTVGEDRSAWAEQDGEDFARVRVALTEAEKTLRIKPGIVTLGFSQGGTVGIELAVRHPDVFAGAIAVSAGSKDNDVAFQNVGDVSKVSGQRFVIVCGAKENPWSVGWSNGLGNWLEKRNAKVWRPSYPEHASHDFPGDFRERLPDWLAFITRKEASER